eukprot:7228980-Alexandrium_andersonii.AAC.1
MASLRTMRMTNSPVETGQVYDELACGLRRCVQIRSMDSAGTQVGPNGGPPRIEHGINRCTVLVK